MQVRIAAPFEVIYGLDDSELLDMTPLKFTENDAAQAPALRPSCMFPRASSSKLCRSRRARTAARPCG